MEKLCELFLLLSLVRLLKLGSGYLVVIIGILFSLFFRLRLFFFVLFRRVFLLFIQELRFFLFFMLSWCLDWFIKCVLSFDWFGFLVGDEKVFDLLILLD